MSYMICDLMQLAHPRIVAVATVRFRAIHVDVALVTETDPDGLHERFALRALGVAAIDQEESDGNPLDDAEVHAALLEDLVRAISWKPDANPNVVAFGARR